MPKMTIRVILKSGAEFAIKCEEFTLKQNALGASGYNIKGISENKPIYLDFEQVAFIEKQLFRLEHQLISWMIVILKSKAF